MTDLIERTAKLAADWWANLLEQGDKAAFQTHLQGLIDARLRAEGLCFLQCDYDPFNLLLRAVRAAGIECDGIHCSAFGILPMKTETMIRPGSIKPFSERLKEGTGTLVVTTDVGYDDHSVYVVGQFDNDGKLIITEIGRA